MERNRVLEWMPSGIGLVLAAGAIFLGYNRELTKQELPDMRSHIEQSATNSAVKEDLEIKTEQIEMARNAGEILRFTLKYGRKPPAEKSLSQCVVRLGEIEYDFKVLGEMDKPVLRIETGKIFEDHQVFYDKNADGTPERIEEARVIKITPLPNNGKNVVYGSFPIKNPSNLRRDYKRTLQDCIKAITNPKSDIRVPIQPERKERRII